MNGRLIVANRDSFKRAINVLFFVLAFIVLIAILWFGPEWQVKHLSQGVTRKDIPSLVNEYRRTWAQILGGIFILLGLYFTWRRVEISQKTLETQQDQQVTERLTRAIDQLGATDDKGNKKLEIRLGGIYALERIARDSPERDYSTAVEILTTYVRANAPYSPERTSDPNIAMNEQEGPPADIQAILDVIRRREENRLPEQFRVHIDLRKTNLVRANLFRANLLVANFEEADLEGANLREANLEANLRGADLTAANLTAVNLTAADLTVTNLAAAILTEANFTEAIIFGVDLREAIGLTQEQINQASGDSLTKLPEGIIRPPWWNTDEQEDGYE